MAEKRSKFIQIATCVCDDMDGTSLHALDDEGRVWYRDRDNFIWRRLSDKRETDGAA